MIFHTPVFKKRGGGGETLGPEMVSNGTFNTNITGWTAVNATASWDALEYIALNPSTALAFMYQSIPVPTGSYKITFRLKCSVAISNLTVRAGGDTMHIAGYTDIGNFTSYEVISESTGAYNYLHVGALGYATVGEIINIDDISMKEIL